MNISKDDIQKCYDEKQMKRKETYNKIALRVMRLMKESAEKGKSMCMYVVPGIILGMPVYNVKECMFYIRDILKEKGFETAIVDPDIILIFWILENKLIKHNTNYDRLENKVSNVYQHNISEQDNSKTVEYNSVRNIAVPQTFFFNH
jgi:hypothetical protein